MNFEGMDFEEFLEMMAKKVFDLNKDRVLNQNTLKLHDWHSWKYSNAVFLERPHFYLLSIWMGIYSTQNL